MSTSDSPRSSTHAVPARGDVRVLAWRGDDAVLLEQLRKDPQRGVALLHDRFAGVVNRLVWRLLGADQDHDDLVQQVFIQLITNVHRVREAEKLRSWVQSVTVNLVYSELRKRGVRRLFIAQARDEERFTDAVSSMESRDLLERIYGALDRMPAKERVVFSLRYIEEKPLKEVAELCECSLATAKRRLKRANERFAVFAGKYPELAARLAVAREDDE